MRLRGVVPAPLLSEGAGLPRTPVPPGLVLRPPAWLVRWPPPCPRPVPRLSHRREASASGSLAARPPPPAEGMDAALLGLQGPRARSEPEAPPVPSPRQGSTRGRAEAQRVLGEAEPRAGDLPGPWRRLPGASGSRGVRRPVRPPRERADRGGWAEAGPGQTRGIPRGNGAGRVRPPAAGGLRGTSAALTQSVPFRPFHPPYAPPATPGASTARPSLGPRRGRCLGSD